MLTNMPGHRETPRIAPGSRNSLDVSATLTLSLDKTSLSMNILLIVIRKTATKCSWSPDFQGNHHQVWLAPDYRKLSHLDG